MFVNCLLNPPTTQPHYANMTKRKLTNRLYSNGDQPVDQYKSYLLHQESNDADVAMVGTFDDTHIGKMSKRQGWGNTLFKNVSPAPMILNAIHGMLDKYDWDVYADCIDSNSNDLKENIAYTKLCSILLNLAQSC